MTAEERILACFARINMDEETEKSAKALLAGVNWDDLVREGKRNELLPLLHHHLKRMEGQVSLPEGLAGSLRIAFMETMARNIVFQGELVKLLKALAAEGIELAVLKGAALVNGVYPNPGMRPMGDIDVLIHREDLERIEKLAEPLGYAPDTAEDLSEGYSREFRNELTLIRSDKAAVRIELHWQLLNFGDETKKLVSIWKKARTQSFDGAEAKVLGPEHLVVYLSEHLAYHHNLDGLLRYCDIAEVLRRYQDEMDWPLLISLARVGHSLPAVREVLHRSALMLDAPVPKEVLAELDSAKISSFDKLFYKLATNENLATTARALMDFMTIRGFGKKTRFALGKFFPSRECLMARWPVKHPWLVYPMYPRRWAEMAWRGMRGLLQLVRYVLRRKA